ELFLGGIQLANRLMYVNFNRGVFSLDFYLNLIRLLNILTGKEIPDTLNRRIVNNCIINVKKIYTIVSSQYNIDPSYVNSLPQGQITHYLEKSDHTLNHWLFFFNKMNNATYYYNFSVHEDKLRLLWNATFEKTNYFETDLSDVVFELKYYSLFNDAMY